MIKIIWYNLILEWNGLLRVLGYREDKIHPLDIVLFESGHQKKRYPLNWFIHKVAQRRCG